MKRILLTLALVSTPAQATDKEIIFQVLNAVDAVETCHIIGSGKGYELNPLMGKKPSCKKVVTIKVVTGVVHYLVSKSLPKKEREIFQTVSIAVQGGVVAANLRFIF